MRTLCFSKGVFILGKKTKKAILHYLVTQKHVRGYGLFRIPFQHTLLFLISVSTSTLSWNCNLTFPHLDFQTTMMGQISHSAKNTTLLHHHLHQNRFVSGCPFEFYCTSTDNRSDLSRNKSTNIHFHVFSKHYILSSKLSYMQSFHPTSMDLELRHTRCTLS